MADYVLVEKSQGVAILTLNRPDQVPCDQLREKTMWLATMIAKNRRESVMGVKTLLLRDMGRNLEEQWASNSDLVRGLAYAGVLSRGGFHALRRRTRPCASTTASAEGPCHRLKGD